MAELSTRKREIRGDRGNHHETLGLEKISCASIFTIPKTAGMSPDPVGNNTNPRSPKPHHASCTPDCSGPLVCFILFSSLSPISLFLVHTSNIIAEHKVESSLSISPCHDQESTPSTGLHQVQLTLGAANT